MTKSPLYTFRSFKAFQKALTNIPEGFSVVVKEEYDDYTKSKYVDVTLENKPVGTSIQFNLRLGKIDKWEVRRNKALKPFLGKSLVEWNGHTKYTHKGGHYSFDRCGVEDSFYNGHDFNIDPNTQVTEQLARIDEARTRIDNCVSIPVIGRLINKDTLEQARKEFQTRKKASYSSYPSGFGMAYHFMKQQDRWSKRADEKIEKFFGYSPLYVRQDEMD
jgi:hypothetical protein